MDPENVEALLRAALPDAQIELIDLTGTKDHYECHIASAAFEGVSPVKQHRLVYAALEGHVGQAIHALALKTYSPAAWQRRAKNG
jgi:acid stress-induced BolA-like protein IbaG/YrbA